MKKIWPWLLLLLLLMIFCVWSKKDSMHLSHTNKTTAISQNNTQMNNQSIEFMLTKKGNKATLNGNFTNTQQQQMLSDAFHSASNKLTIENTSTNKTLVGNDVIIFTKKILPHFIAHYTEGSIQYNNQTLQIDGTVDSYEAQHKMQELLNTTTIATQDNSNVLIKKPIEFSISKNLDTVKFSGIFHDTMQIEKIRSKLPQNIIANPTKDSSRTDNGVLFATEQILPAFNSKYTHGKIVCRNGTLTVSGMVNSNEDLSFMQQLLSKANIPVVNQTTVDMNAVAKRKAEEAKRLEIEKQKAQAEAQRQAALAQAEALAKQKAEEEAKRLEAEKEKVVKEKIAHLLQIENIEFEKAKGVLTSKGEETVDKLASILKQYPNIKAEIAGHTDSDGSAIFNQKLSQDRVDTVKRRLIEKGINAGRLIAKGYGETKPLVPNTTDENKQKNRRVEINILGE